MCSSARDCIFGTTIVSSVTLILGDLWIINFHIHWIYLLACWVAMHHSLGFSNFTASIGEFREQQKASSPGGFYWEEGEWQHTLEIRQETATLHVIRVISEAAVTVWSSTSILHTLSWRLRDFSSFLKSKGIWSSKGENEANGVNFF